MEIELKCASCGGDLSAEFRTHPYRSTDVFISVDFCEKCCDMACDEAIRKLENEHEKELEELGTEIDQLKSMLLERAEMSEKFALLLECGSDQDKQKEMLCQRLM